MADTPLEGISIEGMTATHASSACGGRELLKLCHITLLTVAQPDEAHPSDKARLRCRGGVGFVEQGECAGTIKEGPSSEG